MPVIAPAKSGRCDSRTILLSDTSRGTISSANNATGRLTKKIQRHDDVVDQRAGDDGARRTAEPGDAAPHAERLDPLDRVGEQQRDQAERRRCRERLAGALQEPGRDEHPGVHRGTAGGRRDREDRDAEQEHPSPTEDVGEPAAEQQQAAGHQHVAVDHPREAGLGEVQVVLDAAAARRSRR